MFQSNLLWQNDDRWASVPLGFGPQTIKEWGCLMTCLTMVVNGYGYNEIPPTFNDKMKAARGFSGAMVMPAMVPTAFSGVVYDSYDDCEQSPAPIAKIDAALANGDPVLVQVDWSPQPGLQSHWVLAYARDGNDYLILDPYRYKDDAPGKPLKLLSRYNHSGLALEQAITSAIFMRGAAARPSSPAPSAMPVRPKVAVPADALTLYTTDDDVALRADPALGGALIMRLGSQGAALLALEAKNTAQPKVGQYNQWLQVQEAAGDQGYVAAWYVAAQSQPAASPAAPPSSPSPAAPAGSELIVIPTTDGVALRSQPALDGALIKRLPLTSRLKVLEPAGDGARKLGVAGQWLNVCDITGQAGYVAAWYLSAVDNPAVGVKTAPPTSPSQTPEASQNVIVRTTVDQVTLRSAPVVSDNTVVKRLPLRAELLVTDAGDAAKIGQQNQWIKVKDIDNAAGYVAAWYVSR